MTFYAPNAQQVSFAALRFPGTGRCVMYSDGPGGHTDDQRPGRNSAVSSVAPTNTRSIVLAERFDPKADRPGPDVLVHRHLSPEDI
ncbi:MAG: hypothetical protein GDA52_05820 [Rhodobacteraceae bacterium]|nr:hypothetical protein [Paracoccaceae bacterium]